MPKVRTVWEIPLVWVLHKAAPETSDMSADLIVYSCGDTTRRSTGEGRVRRRKKNQGFTVLVSTVGN